jgi:rod shape determining protein RodA
MQYSHAGRSAASGFSARDLTAPWRHIDGVLMAAVTGVAIMGALMVWSATRHTDDNGALIYRHLFFLVVGVVMMAGVSLLDYRRLADWWQVIYGVSLLALVGVLTPLGAVVNGTSGWYRFGPISLQPAEFAKLGTILAVASYLGSVERVDLRRLGVALGLLFVPLGVTLMQPDLGSALVFVAIALGMLVVGGARVGHLAALAALGVVAIAVVLSAGVLDEYQQKRITSFATPDGQSYNVTQAQTAISSGGLRGYGYGQGPQTRGGFVPVQESDFIFTVAGEEWGFMGAGLLVGLLGVIVWRVWRTAQLAADPLGTLLCVGVMSMLLFHIFENIGMTLGIMPVTGIPLPLVSYGGSSVMASCLAVGVVQSVHMHRFS